MNVTRPLMTMRSCTCWPLRMIGTRRDWCSRHRRQRERRRVVHGLELQVTHRKFVDELAGFRGHSPWRRTRGQIRPKPDRLREVLERGDLEFWPGGALMPADGGLAYGSDMRTRSSPGQAPGVPAGSLRRVSQREAEIAVDTLNTGHGSEPSTRPRL